MEDLNKRAIFVALHQRNIEHIDRLIQTRLLENAEAPLEKLIRAMVDAMIDAHAPNPELDALMFSEVPHRTEGTRDFAVRMHGAFRIAIAARAHEVKGAADPNRMAFIVTHMVDSLCHGACFAVVQDFPLALLG
jgi:Tetracyclin repressor-like, C-terminal domain